MTPEEIKTATLDELQTAVTTMMSPEWDVALEGEPESIKNDAVDALLAAQERRLSLENAQLEKIAHKLIENEEVLKNGKKILMRLSLTSRTSRRSSIWLPILSKLLIV
jgi:hypothetical protein